MTLGKKAVTNLDSILKKQRHYFVDKGPHSKNYDSSSEQAYFNFVAADTVPIDFGAKENEI